MRSSIWMIVSQVDKFIRIMVTRSITITKKEAIIWISRLENSNQTNNFLSNKCKWINSNNLWVSFTSNKMSCMKLCSSSKLHQISRWFTNSKSMKKVLKVITINTKIKSLRICSRARSYRCIQIWQLSSTNNNKLHKSHHNYMNWITSNNNNSCTNRWCSSNNLITNSSLMSQHKEAHHQVSHLQ